MASVIFNEFKQKVANGGVDWDTDTIKVMLVTAAYAPNIDTHSNQSDVTNEVAGTGYTAGGVTLAGATVIKDTTNDRGSLDANDVSWASSTITARAAVIYKDTGTPSTSTLIAYIDFGSDFSSTAGTFSVVWSSAGIITLS